MAYPIDKIIAFGQVPDPTLTLKETSLFQEANVFDVLLSNYMLYDTSKNEPWFHCRFFGNAINKRQTPINKSSSD